MSSTRRRGSGNQASSVSPFIKNLQQNLATGDTDPKSSPKVETTTVKYRKPLPKTPATDKAVSSLKTDTNLKTQATNHEKFVSTANTWKRRSRGDIPPMSLGTPKPPSEKPVQNSKTSPVKKDTVSSMSAKFEGKPSIKSSAQEKPKATLGTNQKSSSKLHSKLPAKTSPQSLSNTSLKRSDNTKTCNKTSIKPLSQAKSKTLASDKSTKPSATTITKQTREHSPKQTSGPPAEPSPKASPQASPKVSNTSRVKPSHKASPKSSPKASPIPSPTASPKLSPKPTSTVETSPKTVKADLKQVRRRSQAMTVAPPPPPTEGSLLNKQRDLGKDSPEPDKIEGKPTLMPSLIKTTRVVRSLFPDDQPSDNPIPSKSALFRPVPPQLPSKLNRPSLQRQSETANSDDLDTISLDSNDNITAKSSLMRQSQSLDDLDSAEPTQEQDTPVVHHTSSDDIHKVKLRKKKSTGKTSLKASFKGTKPVALIKKYLGSSNKDEKRKSTTDSDSKDKKRWSIGEMLKSNIENRFKSSKDTGDASKVLKASSLPGHVKPPTKADIQRLKELNGDSSSHSSEELLYKDNKSSSSDDAGEGSSSDDEDGYDWDDDEFSDEDVETTTNDMPRKSLCYENVVLKDPKDAKQKRRQIMEEILSTETNYVNKLYLLNKTAWEITGANLVHEMFPQIVVHQMFPSIEALYRLHGENILPALKHRLEDWSTKPELASMWKKYLPFLTMYKSYTSQYDWAIDVISQHKKSSDNFAQCLQRIEEKSEFGKLRLEHHLLEPIQRIARYKLLMENYYKLLGETDEEKTCAKDIVDAFEKLLQACQSQLKQKDIFGDLCKLQERFETTLSMLSPTAQVITEGAVVVITGSNSKKKKHRHLFLFTDSLLICSKRPTGKFKIIQQMELPDLKIRPVDANCAAAFSSEKTMLLKEKDTSVILYFKEIEKKDDWEDRILDAISVKMMERKLRRDGSYDVSAPRETSVDFGLVPAWISDDHVTSCMACDVRFIVFVRRKHHCRGCGVVVCGSCSSQKMALPSMNGEVCRVCDSCFLVARGTRPNLTRRISTRQTARLSRIITRTKERLLTKVKSGRMLSVVEDVEDEEDGEDEDAVAEGNVECDEVEEDDEYDDDEFDSWSESDNEESSL